MTVCFFGHRDTPESAQSILHRTLVELIEQHGADRFYVGNQGSFDVMVLATLKMLKKQYPHIQYAVVLAYLPTQAENFSDTVYPEGLETVPRRYAIDHRNRWMIEQAETVVCYVSHSFGGAPKYQEFACKKGRQVLNLYGRK